MEDAQIRALIRTKISEGRLPRVALTHVLGGPSGQGDLCVACNERIEKGHLSMGGQRGAVIIGPFHARCLHPWDSERREEGPVFRLPSDNGSRSVRYSGVESPPLLAVLRHSTDPS